MIDYQPIEAHLKKLSYLTLNSHVKTWIGGKVVGFNVAASPQIRKNASIERVKKEIDENNLPLIVDDPYEDDHPTFRLMIKL